MKYIKRKILQYLTKNLLKVVNEDDILKITSEGYFVGKNKIHPEQVVGLKQEAQLFLKSDVWMFAKKELEFVAFVRGRQAKTDEDNLATHYLYYNIDIIEQFLRNLSK